MAQLAVCLAHEVCHCLVISCKPTRTTVTRNDPLAHEFWQEKNRSLMLFELQVNDHSGHHNFEDTQDSL